MRSTFNREPEQMSDQEVGKLVAEALFLKEFDKQIFKTAIAEVISVMFGA